MEAFIIVAILATLLVTPTAIALKTDSTEKNSRTRPFAHQTARPTLAHFFSSLVVGVLVLFVMMALIAVLPALL
ncbi:hypothetical protein [Nocardia sp. NPDC057668]|uniref:hypothetical protein n=1 Tax=Nocardia sp. NPDC057668 TaxID=3346202 RepID=UPI0036726145